MAARVRRVSARSIREKRAAAGLETDKLAEIVGVTEAAILHIENGRKVPSAVELSSIASACGVQVDELIENTTYQERRVSAQNIRDKRRAAGLKSFELADIVGVSESAISHYESGRKVPSASLLASIASAVQVQMDELMETVE